jgi:hypothetical protein
MFCLSRDGLCVTEANSFHIEKTISVFRYYRDGGHKFNIKDNTMYCLRAADGCLMDAFETEEEAKDKLREVTRALASGVDIFEF